MCKIVPLQFNKLLNTNEHMNMLWIKHIKQKMSVESEQLFFHLHSYKYEYGPYKYLHSVKPYENPFHMYGNI